MKPISKIGFGTLSLWKKTSNEIIAKHVPKIWVHRKCSIATSGGAANVLVRVSHSSSTAGTGVHCFANVSGIALTHSERMMCQSNCHLVYCLIFQDLNSNVCFACKSKGPFIRRHNIVLTCDLQDHQSSSISFQNGLLSGNL